MKRLLLPLLAALALPTAVNAEYLNLECKINSIFDDSIVKEKYNFSINLNGNDTKITASKFVDAAMIGSIQNIIITGNLIAPKAIPKKPPKNPISRQRTDKIIYR